MVNFGSLEGQTNVKQQAKEVAYIPLCTTLQYQPSDIHTPGQKGRQGGTKTCPECLSLVLISARQAYPSSESPVIISSLAWV